MLIALAVSASISAVFTKGDFVITRDDGYADHTTVILVAVATRLGMLALVGGLGSTWTDRPASGLVATQSPAFESGSGRTCRRSISCAL
jgi:hypothetical protein